MKTLDALQAGQLKGAKRLDLAAGLTQFPLEILDLADSLEILDLTPQPSAIFIPDQFGLLTKAEGCFLQQQQLCRIAARFVAMSQSFYGWL